MIAVWYKRLPAIQEYAAWKDQIRENITKNDLWDPNGHDLENVFYAIKKGRKQRNDFLG